MYSRFSIKSKKNDAGDLEKNACKQLIDKLIDIDKCKIDLLLTDRHVGIRHLLKTCYTEITHEFDLWHLSKSLMKKFKTINKKYEEVLAWKQSISNHLWWSAQTCSINTRYHFAYIHSIHKNTNWNCLIDLHN